MKFRARLTYPFPVLVAIAATGSLAACLEIGDDPDPPSVCQQTSDCGNGEFCQEGVCWGNPPERAFAALLLPPTDQASVLAPTEIPALDIAPDGTITNLQFADSVVISGRIVVDCEAASPDTCDPIASVDAQLVIRRSSRLPGEPHYVRIATSVAGAPPGEASFSVVMPVSAEPYEVTVVPNTSPPRADESLTPHAELAPPTTFFVLADRDRFEQWTIGHPDDYRVITGRIVNNLGVGLAGMNVSVPREGPDQVATRLSSAVTTDSDGFFTLRVPRELGQIELLAVPEIEGSAPTLHRQLIELPSDGLPFQLTEDLVMPPFTETEVFTIPIEGIDSNGNKFRISGADVKVTTVLESGPTSGLTATFSTVATTDDDGRARLNLIPGNVLNNRRYTINVKPPAGSEHQALYGRTIEIGFQGGVVLAAIALPRRVALGGALHRKSGAFAVGTTVTASFSRSFRGRLAAADLALRGFADTLPLASATTNASGRFLLWLDRTLVEPGMSGEVALADMASYDLLLTPQHPLGALWSVHGLDMRELETGTIELGDVQVPEAAYARGVVTRPDGAPVGDAQLRLFEIVEHDSFCEREDAGPCERAVHRGVWNSRIEDGRVMAILPDPDRAPRPSALAGND